MKIRIDEKYIYPTLNTEVIGNILSAYTSIEVPRLEKLSSYYKGKNTTILEKPMTETGENTRVVSGFPSYITNFMTSYFISVPVKYHNLNDELENYIYNNNDQTHNTIIARDLSIYGIANELLYISQDVNNKAIIKYKRISPSNCFVIYSNSLEEEIIAGVRFYNYMDYVSNKIKTFLEIYTNTEVYSGYVEGNKVYIEENYEHNLDRVPINVFSNNLEEMGDFERLLYMIDEYDLLLSNVGDTFKYSADSLLQISDDVNLALEDEIEAKNQRKAIRDSRIIFTTKDGVVKFITKEVNHVALNTYKDTLSKDIIRFANVIDLSDDNFAGNVSGVAMEFKLLGLENITKTKESGFITGLRRRLQIMNSFSKALNGVSINTNEIDFTFTRNIPKNLNEIADYIVKLDGIISRETLIAQLPFVNNVDKELLESEKEQQVSINFGGITSSEQQ